MARISGRPSYRMIMNKVVATLSHITLICGAVISGYGELIFRHSSSGDSEDPGYVVPVVAS